MGKRAAKPGNAKVAIVYLRASTSKQDTSPEVQLAAVAIMAAREGIRIAGVFTETAVSGSVPVDERPELVKALAAIRTTGAGLLLASKRDRLARSVLVSAQLEAEVTSRGATVRTADGTSDGHGSSGALMKGLHDLFASHERAIIRERTTAALSQKKAKGERLGCLPYGYHAPDGVHVEPHPGEQEIIAAAQSLRAQGMTQQNIAETLTSRGYRNRIGGLLKQTQIGRMLTSAQSTVAA